jgi:hypothetical protein
VRKRPLKVLSSFFVVALLSLRAATSSPQDAEVEGLILKLGASEIAERETASRALLDRGEAVRPALDRAASNPNKEIAARARRILATLDRHVDALTPVLDRIRKESGDSYQRMIRDATHAVAAIFEGKDLRRMTQSLERQGFTLEKWRNEPAVAGYRIAARPAVYASPAGVRHDLVLELTTDFKPSKTEPTQEIVRRAGAVLRTRQEIALAEILAKPYPAKTALALAFAHKESRAGESEYPIIEVIELEYQQFGSHRDKSMDWGFNVVIRCTNREHSGGYVASHFFTSGLDAHQEVGKAENPPDFVPQDTLEHSYASGSGSWTSSWGTRTRELRRDDYKEPPSWYELYRKAPTARGGGDLKSLPADLTALTVKGTEYTSQDGESLLRFTKLRSLSWDVDPRSLAGVSIWIKLPALEALEVSNSGIDDDLLQRLSRATQIKDLTLRRCDEVTDDGVAPLTKLEGLRRLIIWDGTRLTDRALEHFSKLKNLKSLHLTHWGRITDVGLEHLSRLPRLESVSFDRDVALTAKGLTHLEKMPSLKDIDCTFSSIDDAGFEALGRIATLEVLWLREVKKVTDKGLRHLKGLKELRLLHVDDCPGITTEGLKDLQAALPGQYSLK